MKKLISIVLVVFIFISCCFCVSADELPYIDYTFDSDNYSYHTEIDVTLFQWEQGSFLGTSPYSPYQTPRRIRTAAAGHLQFLDYINQIPVDGVLTVDSASLYLVFHVFDKNKDIIYVSPWIDLVMDGPINITINHSCYYRFILANGTDPNYAPCIFPSEADKLDMTFHFDFQEIPPEVPDYDTWYGNILSGITEFFSGVFEGLATAFSNIADGINGFWQGMTIKLTELKNSITNLKDIISDKLSELKNSFVDNIVSLKNSFVDNIVSLKNSFVDSIVNFKNNVMNIPDLIGEKIDFLFNPTVDIMPMIRNKFNNKFPIIEQAKSMFSGLFNIGTNAPVFDINYQGMTLSVVNFTAFESYMPLIRGITGAFIMLTFLPREIKRLPALLRGQNTQGGS